MADTVRGTIYPNLPGNCPDEGYVLVSKQGFVEPPLSSENLNWEKLTQVTDADKQQIQENKQNIESLEEEVSNIETALDDKSEVSGENDGTNWTSLTIDGTTKAIPSGGGGGGFTPTQAQLDAMNSGIDSTKVSQIETNKDDIASLSEDVTDLQTDKQDKLTPGDGIVITGTNIEANVGDGLELATQGAGTNKVIKAKVDGTTITTNASGELEVIGGGGGSTTIKGKALHEVYITPTSQESRRAYLKLSYISDSSSSDLPTGTSIATADLKSALTTLIASKKIINADGIMHYSANGTQLATIPIRLEYYSVTSTWEIICRSIDFGKIDMSGSNSVDFDTALPYSTFKVEDNVKNINGGEFELLLANLVYEGATTGTNGVLYFSNYLPLPTSYRNALINFTISYEEGVEKSNERIMAGVLDGGTKYTRWLESGGELGLVITNKGKFCLATTGTVKKNGTTISAVNLKYQWDNTNKQLKVTDNNDVLLFTYNISSLKVRWD